MHWTTNISAELQPNLISHIVVESSYLAELLKSIRVSLLTRTQQSTHQ